MLTAMEWIKTKCRNGLIFVSVYGTFVVMMYLATIPPDRSNGGILGAGISILENVGRGIIMLALLTNPAVCFLTGRALTALVRMVC